MECLPKHCLSFAPIYRYPPFSLAGMIFRLQKMNFNSNVMDSIDDMNRRDDLGRSDNPGRTGDMGRSGMAGTGENEFEADNLTGRNHEGPQPNMPVQYLTASSIMSDKVINSEGEKLGDVRDVMLDVRQGKIEYVVMESGGFLGIGEKLFAIPYKLLSLDTDNHAFVLDQDKETIENAPGFDKDHWPETNDQNFEGTNDSYWDNTNSYWGSFMGPNTGAMPYR